MKKTAFLELSQNKTFLFLNASASTALDIKILYFSIVFYLLFLALLNFLGSVIF